MNHDKVSSLPIALRVYPQPQGLKAETWSRKPWQLPDAIFIFDTESRVDHTQRLTFGSYRFIASGRCLEEGLFYGHDLPDDDREVLERYVVTHSPETVRSGHPKLRLLPRREFVERLYRAAYRARCLLIAFNLPFDAARIACDFLYARERFAGGFSLGLASYTDNSGRERPDPHRPRIAIKNIEQTRAQRFYRTSRSGQARPDSGRLRCREAPRWIFLSRTLFGSAHPSILPHRQRPLPGISM